MFIAGFAQLRNELEKGNLHNFFKCMEKVCDVIYIYDQNSTDGSQEVYKARKDVVVIHDNENNFKDEISCKRLLLQRLLSENPQTDWIFWMDGDTLVDGRVVSLDREAARDKIEDMLAEADDVKVDCVGFRHLNLWRSDNWTRTDNQYHDLYQYGVRCFWKNNGQLEFPASSGLHLNQFPNGMTKVGIFPYFLVHRGFSTDDQIMNRYDLYKSRGQSGNALERLLDEQTLDGVLIDPVLLPKWFEPVFLGSPENKQPIREIYNAR